MSVDKNSVIAQSNAAYNQWCEIWRKNADEISRLAPHKPMNYFSNIGVGRACLVVANGFSFEKHIETIKANKDNVDIFCCDKTLGHLLDNGITPTYCMVCDANVDYEKYMKPWEDQLQDTVMFSNVCANTEWSFNGNWKEKVYFVNKDAIQSEKEFCEISKCQNTIPAATNVSNAMVVFLTQSDNSGRKNYFGYDKILLIGFDYSWTLDGSYYAFDKTGNGKSNYMRHVYVINNAGKHAYTSGNLLFSAQWLEKYIRNFSLPVVQCDDETLLGCAYSGKLEKQIKYEYKTSDRSIVRSDLNKRARLLNEVNIIEKRINEIGKDHHSNFIQTL
jgi:hypothetical protein